MEYQEELWGEIAIPSDAEGVYPVAVPDVPEKGVPAVQVVSNLKIASEEWVVLRSKKRAIKVRSDDEYRDFLRLMKVERRSAGAAGKADKANLPELASRGRSVPICNTDEVRAGARALVLTLMASLPYPIGGLRPHQDSSAKCGTL